MSDSNLNVGIDSSQAVAGANTAVRSINDISAAANNLQTKLQTMEASMGKIGASSGLSQAQRAMNDLNSSSKDLGKLLTSIEDRFIRIGATAIGMWAVTKAFEAMTIPLKKSVEYLALIETATLGIASSLMVVGQYQDTVTGKVIKGQAAMTIARKESKEVIDQLRVANMDTIATLDELIVAYQTALPVAMARGFDKKQVMDFTLAMVQAAGAIGLPFNQMSEEIRSLLTVGAINPRNSRIATVLGLRNEDLAQYKANSEGLFDFLMKRLEGFTVAGLESQKTLKGIWSNITDVAKQLGGDAFGSIFEGIKTELKGLLDSVVTFDSVARTATWNQKWVDGAKEVNAWMKSTFNTLMTVSKAIIEHADIIWGIVKAYGAYLLVTTTVNAINKLMAVTSGINAKLTAEKTRATLSAVSAEALYAESLALSIELQGANMTVAAENTASKRRQILASEQLLASNLAGAEAEAIKVASLIAENNALQANNSSQYANLIARGQVLVVEEQEAAARLASATALYEQTAAMSANTLFTKEAAAIEAQASAEYQTARTARINAETALQSKMAFSQQLYNEEAVLLNRNTAATIALTQARTASMLPAATQAALAYNTALAAQGVTTGAVTGAELALRQARFLSLSTNVQQSIVLKAHTVALGINEAVVANNVVAYELWAIGANAATVGVGRATVALVASEVAMYATAAAATVLNTAFNLIGGWLGVIVIAIYVAVKAWNDLANAKEKAMKKSMANAESANAISEQLKAEIEQFKAQEKLKAEIKKKGVDNVDTQTVLEAALGSDLALYKTLTASVENYNQRVSVLRQTGQKEELARITAVRDAEVKSLNELTSLKLARYEQTKNIQHMITPKPPKEEKDKISQEEKAFNSLLKSADQWELKAIRSGKVTDEVGAKWEELHQIWVNLLESDIVKNAKLFDAKGTKEELDKIKNAINEVYDNFKLADSIKAQKTISDATAKVAKDAYKAELDEQKSMLKLQLDDNLISQKEYHEGMLANISKTTNARISDLEGLVSEKEKALYEDSSTSGSNQQAKLIADLIKAEGELAAFRLTASKEYSKENADNVRAIEKQRKALVELQNSAKDAQLALDASKASRVGTSPLTGAVTDSVANTSAMAQSEFDKTIENIKRESDAISQRILTEKLGDEELIALQQRRWAITQGIGEAQIALNQKIAASKAAEEQKAYDSLAAMASKTFPKIQGLEKVAAMAGRQYDKDATKDKLDSQGKLVRSTELSSKGQKQLMGDVAGFGASVFSGLADAQDQSSRKGFESAKAFSMAAAVMSTAQAVMMALASAPPPYSFALAAAAAAMGVIQIATIASTSFGGSGSVSAPSGSFGGASGASGSGTGISNLPQHISTIADSRSNESIDKLIGSTDNASLVIGRLSKSIDSLNDLFSTGGAGFSLANNAPNKFTGTSEIATTMDTLMDIGKGYFNAAVGLFTLDFKKMVGGVSDLVGGVKSAVFGGDWQTTGAGISLGVDSGNVTARDYVTSQKDGGMFHSDKTSTTYTNNNEAAEYLNNIVTDYFSDITNMARTLGTTVDASALNLKATNIATAGRSSEDIAKDMEKWMTEALQAMSLTVEGLAGFSGTYDDAYTVLKQLNDALVTTNDSFSLIGKTALDSSMDSAKWAVSLQNMFGGMDGFTEAMEDYFSVMYTDAEQAKMKAAAAKTDVTNAFAEMYQTVKIGSINVGEWFGRSGFVVDIWGQMNVAIPETIGAFNDLRNSLNVTTEEGAQLFHALTEIAPAFAEMIKYAEEIAAATRDMNMELLSLKGLEGSADYLRLLNEQREAEIALLDPSLQSLQRQINAQIDLNAASEIAAESLAKQTELQKTNLSWQQQIDVLEGKSTQLQIDRFNQLSNVTEQSTIDLIGRVYALQDEKTAADAAAAAADAAAAAATAAANELSKLAETNTKLQQSLDLMTGNITQREIDRIGVTDALTLSLMDQINVQEDLKTAADAAAEAIAKQAALQRTNNELTVTLLELQGKTVESLALSRQLETEGMDVSTLAIKQQIYTLQDQKTAADAELKSLQERADITAKAYASAEKVLDDSYAAQRDIIVKGQVEILDNLKNSLEEATKAADKLQQTFDMLKSAREGMQLSSVDSATMATAQADLASILTSARNGDTSRIAGMGDTARIVSSISADSYTNSAEYQRAFWQTSNSLLELETITGKQLNDAQRQVDLLNRLISRTESSNEATLKAFDAELNMIKSIGVNVIPIAEARTQYELTRAADAAAQLELTTQTSWLNAQYDMLTNVNNSVLSVAAAMDNYLATAGNSFIQNSGFASNYITPAAVISSPESNTVMFSGTADSKEIEAKLDKLIAELESIRADNRAVSTQTVKHLKTVADLAEKDDIIGIPETRAAA